MLFYLRLVVSTLRRAGTPRRDLLWENLALRQQLAIYQRQTHRPQLRQRDRLFCAWRTHPRSSIVAVAPVGIATVMPSAGDASTGPDSTVTMTDPAVAAASWPGFGSFPAAAQFCAAFDALRQYFRVRSRPGPPMSLATRRRLFVARWRSLIREMQVA